jgi:hypothetical protein
MANIYWTLESRVQGKILIFSISAFKSEIEFGIKRQRLAFWPWLLLSAFIRKLSSICGPERLLTVTILNGGLLRSATVTGRRLRAAADRSSRKTSMEIPLSSLCIHMR